MNITSRVLLSLAASTLTGAAIGGVCNVALRGRGIVPRLIVLAIGLPVSGAIGEAVGEGVFALSGMSSAELRESVSRFAYRAADSVHRAVSA